jgi:hypothetical protein
LNSPKKAKKNKKTPLRVACAPHPDADGSLRDIKPLSAPVLKEFCSKLYNLAG